MQEAPVERDTIPWKPGQIGHPIGRRNKMAFDIAHLALEFAPRALGWLMEIAEHARDPKTRILAINSILDRGLGKPAQRQEHTGEGGGPITVIIGVKQAIAQPIEPTLPITRLISTTNE